MKYIQKRYLRFWKSYAKRTKDFWLHKHYFHNRLLLDASEPTSLEIYAGYEFEFEEYALVAEVIKKHDIETFLDIGANWGGYSLLAARQGVPRVESFEPNRKVFGLLAANISLNRYHKIVRAWNLAAGAEDTVAFLKLDPRATDVSTLSPDSMPSKFQYTDQQECMVRKIDDFLPISNQSVFIKIDVEGHERETIKGLENTIKHNRTHMLIEILDNSDVLETLKSKYGMKFQKSFGKNYYLTNTL